MIKSKLRAEQNGKQGVTLSVGNKKAPFQIH